MRPRPRPCASGSMPTTYTSPSVAECRLVQWKPSIRSSSVIATNSPSGSNHGSAIRSASSVGVHAALLGVVGEGGGVDAQQLGLVTGPEGPDLRGGERGDCRDRGRPSNPASGRRITQSSRTRSKPIRRRQARPRPGGRRATRPARRGQRTRARASSRRAPTPVRRWAGATTRCSRSPSSDRRCAMPGSTWHVELVGVVAQPSPGALVEGLAPSPPRSPGDRLDLAQLRWSTGDRAQRREADRRRPWPKADP